MIDWAVDPAVVAVLFSMWVYFANKISKIEERLTRLEDKLEAKGD